jgi:hypothetical protein
MYLIFRNKEKTKSSPAQVFFNQLPVVLFLFVCFFAKEDLCLARVNYVQSEGGGGGGGCDPTPPTTPLVYDDGVSTYDLSQLHATWSSQDPQSGISEYRYGIGTELGTVDVVNWTSAGLNTQITHTGLSLVIGQYYYFTVKARNGCGLWSQPGNSDGIVALNQPPEIISILPENNSTFTEGDIVNIEVQAEDASDALDFRFSVDSVVIRDWDCLNTYSWQTQAGDLKLKTITVDVRDEYGATDSGETNVFIFRKPPSPE